MANIFPSGPGDNEGSVSWSGVSGSPTVTNSTDYAVTGVQSVKAVSVSNAALAIAIAYGDRITCLPSTSYTTTFNVRASASRWISAAINWYTSGGSYISTTVLDGAGNANTGAWENRVDVSTSPGTAGSFTLKFDYDSNTTGQAFYADNITVDDGVSAIKGINPLLLIGLA